jgi:hypothetical protein
MEGQEEKVVGEELTVVEIEEEENDEEKEEVVEMVVEINAQTDCLYMNYLMMIVNIIYLNLILKKYQHLLQIQ